jgi:YD repeat-containing protein
VAADGTTSSGWGAEPYNGINTYLYRTSSTVLGIGCQSSENPAAIAKQGVASYLSYSILRHTFSIASAAAVGSEISEALGGIVVSFLTNALMGGLSSPPDQHYTLTQCQSSSTVANNTLPWGYARTEVISLLSTGSIGKVVYEYTNPSNNFLENRPFDIPTPHFRSSSRPRSVPWVYGLPKTISVYDKNTNLVKQTINHFNPIVNATADNNFVNGTWTAIGRIYGCSPSYPGPGSSQIAQETYYPFTGRVELTSTDEMIYNSAQQFNATTTYFEYDNNFQVKHQYSNNSKGEKVETYFYRAYDYAQAQGAINIMGSSSSNIVEPVLSSETYINKASGKYMISASATDYDQFSNGDIKPKVTYDFQNLQPVPNNALSPFNTATVQRDPSYFKQIASYNYDNNGNLVQTLTGGNTIKSSIYDYDGRLLVASVLNASYADIGYSSFEAQGGKPGSWLNPAAIVDNEARTGNKCFNLSDPSNAANGYFGFSGLNTSLSYVVSFWAKNGTACINGAINGQSVVNTCQGGSGWKQGTTVNGWTYYEIQINNVERISASGSGLIDEFRIYPVGAQMTTITYKPLVGKTSECDASGRVLYYSYDDLGRLVKVSDDQRNVIKTYEYNYKQ